MNTRAYLRTLLLTSASLLSFSAIAQQVTPAPGIPYGLPLPGVDSSITTLLETGGTTGIPLYTFAQDSRGLDIRSFYQVSDGSDYSLALSRAIAQFNTNYAAGFTTPVYIPPGIWPINTPLTTQFAASVPSALGGNGMFTSYLQLGSGFTGTLFGCSQTSTQFGTPTIYPHINSGVSGNNNGCNIHDISIAGNLTSTGQDAIVLSDNVDSARVERVEVTDLPGYCLSAGQTLTQTHAFLRESLIDDLVCYNTGTSSKASVDISSTGTQDASNVDVISNLRVFQSAGDGLVLENNNSGSPMRQITVTNPNIEASTGNNIRIGSTSLSGSLFSIDVVAPTVLSPSSGNNNILVTGSGATTAPSSVTFRDIRSLPGSGTGGGINIQYGKNITASFAANTVTGTQLTVGCGVNSSTGNIHIVGQGDEATWTRSLCGSFTSTKLFIANDPVYNAQVFSALSIGTGGGNATAIDGTGSVTLATTSDLLSFTDGVTSLSNVKGTLTVSGITVGGTATAPTFTVPAFSVTDGINSFSGIKSLAFSGATVGGTAVNPTVTVTQPTPISTSYFITTSQTVALPTGWHSINYRIVGGGGGSGCGYVVTSGTAISGGSGGGDATPKTGVILASQYPYSSILVNIGNGGTGCVASGTTSGSSGSTPTGGTATTLFMNSSLVDTAWAGGAGANGSTSASNGGGSAGLCGNGANNVAGSCGGVTNGAVPPYPFFGGAGQSGPLSTQPAAASITIGLANAQAGTGLASTPAALAGRAGLGATPYTSTGGGAAGNSTCSSGSENGGAATDNAPANALTGATGGSGASCTTANGGNAGPGAGYGVGAPGGGSTLAGFTAGNGASGQPGAASLVIN